MSNFLYSMPLIKDLFIKVAMIRFCRSFSTLLKGGVSFVEALKLSSKIMKHPHLEKEMQKTQAKIMEGKKLSDCLKESSYVPLLVTRMLSIAEEGGKMPNMLQHIAEIYEDELQRSLKRFTVMIQPIMLLFLGVIVGFIVLAVLLPLTDVGSFIST